MDFFSRRHANNGEDIQDTKDFASAIQDRFGSHSILTARLSPVQEPVHPVRNVTINPTSVTPSTVPDWLNSQSTLILDIRPHAAYSQARIPNAVPLSVPSTLLKRPAFSLQRLAAMLPSSSARSKFLSYQSSSRILVYDADAHQIPENSNICGLLKKFANDGYNGELAWLKGGFQSVWRERRDLVDQRPPTPERSEDDEDEASTTAPVAGGLISAAGGDNHHHHHRTHLAVPGGPSNSSNPVLRPSILPSDAFNLSSTTRSHPNLAIPMHMSLRNPPVTTSATSGVSSANNTANTLGTNRPAFNPFFDTIRQNVELSHGITERIPLRLPRRVRRRIDDLPFDWLKEIARRADILIPVASAQRTPSMKTPSLSNSKRLSPDEIKSISASTSSGSLSSVETSATPSPPDLAMVEEGMEALAMQFYRIELAEQRRLMGVMEHHSKESSTFDAQRKGREDKRSDTQLEIEDDEELNPAAFPFSITAGVEKGAKNRYRHIWPFEHARVRLHQENEGSPVRQSSVFHETPSIVLEEKDDYVNASYVQPLGTTKRYIATQGPLEATFDDFWRLCWEQNVHVIVMLTKEVEGSMVKCGAYWADVGSASSPLLPDPVRKFGPLTLKLVSKVGYTSGMRAGKEKGINLMHQTKDGLKKLNAITTDALTGGGGGGFAFPVMPAPSTKQGYRSGSSERRREKKRIRDRKKLQSVAGLDPFSGTEATTSTTEFTSDSANLSGSEEEDVDVGRITTIQRTFELSHEHYPEVGPRKVVQLQYLEWPDMNVPDDPRGILDLIERVDLAVGETGGSGEADSIDFRPSIKDNKLAVPDIGAESGYESGSHSTAKGKRPGSGVRWEKKEMLMDKKRGVARHAMGSKNARPVLLHCSAGVGRTGGYIALDAILDGVKREMRKKRMGSASTATSSTQKQSMYTSGESRIQSSTRGGFSRRDSNSEEEGAAMDVDTENQQKVKEDPGPTVPITMSGAEHDIIHVPTVVVPKSRSGSASGAESGSADVSGSTSGSAQASASASPPLRDEEPKVGGKKNSRKEMVRRDTVTMNAADNNTMDVDRDEDSPSGGSRESSAAGSSGLSGSGASAERSGGSSRDGGLSSSVASAGVGSGSGESSDPANLPTVDKRRSHHSHGPSTFLTKKWAQNVHESQLDNANSGGSVGGNDNASDSSSFMIVEPSLPGASSSSASLPPISESGHSSSASSGIGRSIKAHHLHHPGHSGQSHRSSSPARVSTVLSGTQLQQHLLNQHRQKKKMEQLRQKGGHTHGHGTAATNSGVPGAVNLSISAPSLSSTSSSSLSGSAFPSISDSDDVLMGSGPGEVASGSLPTSVSEAGSSDKGKGREMSVEMLGVLGERRSSVEDQAAQVAAAALAQQKMFAGTAASERMRTTSFPQSMRMAPSPSRGSMAERAKAAMGQAPGQAFALSLPTPAFNLNFPGGRAGPGPATDTYPALMRQMGQQQPLPSAPVLPPQSSVGTAIAFNLPGGLRTGQSDATSTKGTTFSDSQQSYPANAPGTGFYGNKPASELKNTPGSFPFAVPTSSSAQQNRSEDTSENSHARQTRVDYKEPRALHVEDGSPVSLSKFEAPVWEVIQDMREQRMSLCQSLRQYVFVHAAIVEGALRLVDEEREREERGAEKEEIAVVGALKPGGAPAELNAQQIEMSRRQEHGYMGMDIDTASTATSTHIRSSSTGSFDGSSSVVSSPSKKGKRGASPTELLMEGKGGEVRMSKRPSLKRKTRTPSEAQPRLDTLPQSPAVTPSKN